MTASAPRPPRAARFLLRRFSPPHQGDIATGDFDELFHLQVERLGPRRASFWYWRQAIWTVLLSLFWGSVLLRNHLKAFLRSVRKQKGYAFLNIAGLSVGLAVCIVIVQWIRFEQGIDRFHEKAGRLHRVVYSREGSSGKGTYFVQGAAPVFLKDNYSEIVDATRICAQDRVLIKSDERNIFADISFVDPAFFRMFSFPLLEGSAETVFASPLSIVLSEDLAEKFFGNDHPINKILKCSYWGRPVPLKVTGVIADPPPDTDLRYQALLPYRLAPSNASNWSNQWPIGYVETIPDLSLDALNARISGVIKQNVPESKNNLWLQPLTESHLHNLEGPRRIRFIRIFMTLGLFILVMAGINFINLSTARASVRFQEIGIKKMLGASRRHLMGQVLTESLAYSFTALAAALLLTAILLPAVGAALGRPIPMDLSPSVAAVLIGITLVTGLASGLFPAFYLSSLSPQIISGRKISPARIFETLAESHRGRPGRSPLMRRALVLFQLMLLVSFMVGVLVIKKQMDYIQNKDLGLKKQHMLVVDIPRDTAPRLDALKIDLLANPAITGATGISGPVTQRSNFITNHWGGLEHAWEINVGLSYVDYDFADTFGLDLYKGRFFSREFPNDTFTKYVANRTLAEALGIEYPIGVPIRNGGSQGTIIGVVDDFHVESLHREIRPHILILGKNIHFRQLYLRIDSTDLPGTIDFIKGKIETFSPGYPFEYRFFDEELDRLYRTDRLTHKLITSLMVIAVLLACLGLFGLIAFTAERRTKEIGIRKVMGASVYSVVRLISREYVVLVAAANLAAWPAAYVIMSRWLDNFAYRTPISPWIFAAAGGLSLLLSILTVSWQSIRVGLADPVASLRSE